MTKDSPSDGGGSPAPLRPPQQTPHKAPCQHSAGSGANSSGCGPPPSPFHDDHRRELETLRAKLEEERLHSREARRCFAVEARELRQAAEQDRQLLADQLRSKWEQQRARELHQLREATARHREAEIRQLMRWKEAELREAQELLWQERDAAMRQARDLQRQLAKELVSHGGGSSRGEGGASGGGPNAESHTKLQEVLGKLRWEVDGDQAARIRHLKAELELERSLFLKYILEPFEGEPLPVGSPHRFSQASSPQHLGRARPHSWQSRTAASTPDVTSVFRSRSLVNNPSRGESPCRHPLLEEGSPSDSSCQERSQKKALGKELDVEKESKQEASVDSPPKGRVGTWGAAGECAQEAQPQQGWLSGNSYNQLVKQNTDLLKALRELEQRCTRLREENTLLRRSSFPDRVKWLKRKAAELAVIAQRLDESSKKFQELRLLKLCENLRREVEEKQKRCDEIELKLNTMLSENARLSEENSQLQKENKQEEKIENENADLKVKLMQATDERNSAVQLAEGLEAKIENLEQVIKDMKQTAERQQRSKSEHEKTLLELQKKEEEIQRLQQAQREIKRHYEEEVQLLDAEVNELENHYHSQTEHFDLLSQELERLQIQKSGILGSELSQATCSSTGTSCPEKWEQETYHALHCSDSTNDEDRASVASVDLIKSPSKLRVFLARDSYDPFNGPNKTPEAELPLTAGEYVYVCGDMDEDGFYEGELMDGRRGMVPSNMVEEVAGNDLISFIPSEPSDISYNSFHETSFPCQCASSDRRSSSPDEEDVCVSLLSKTPEGTVRDAQAAVPYPQNVTLLKQSARSIVIGWDPPQVPKSWGEVLSYNIYVNAELRQNVKEGSEMRTVIENLDLKLQTYRISVQSVTDKGHSDEMQCTFLVGNTSHIAPTLPNLRNITATSAEVTWLPSNSNYTHAVYLNEKKYGVTKAGVHWCTFQNLRPSTRYSVKVVPLVPNEALVYPQRGLEQGSTEVTFTTPSAGPPDAPLDVQVHAGSSADFLVINWLPVTIHASGTSNGVQVIGYAIYVSGQKVTEIMSPTAGSVSLEVSQLKMLQGPQTVSVRTVSPFGESGDSVQTLIPSTLLKVPHTLFSKYVASGLTFNESLESEGRPVPATTCTSSSSFSHMCVSNPDTSFTAHFTANCKDSVGPMPMDSISQNHNPFSHSHTMTTSHIVRDENNGDSISQISAGKQTLQQPFSALWHERSANSTPTVVEAFAEEADKDEDVGAKICLQEAPDKFPEDQMEQIQQPCKELSILSVSELEAQEDRTSRTGSWRSSLGDYSHNSDLSDIEEEEEEEDQESKLSISGEHACEPQGKAESPIELAKDKIITMTLRGDQTVTPSVSNSGPRRNVAAGDSVCDDSERVFVALFDYDPTTMSPNSDADEEELPFKKGQILKVIGDKDADGFYRGECEGKKGLIPGNMVSEMRIDSMEVKKQLLKKAYEG